MFFFNKVEESLISSTHNLDDWHTSLYMSYIVYIVHEDIFLTICVQQLLEKQEWKWQKWAQHIAPIVHCSLLYLLIRQNKNLEVVYRKVKMYTHCVMCMNSPCSWRWGRTAFLPVINCNNTTPKLHVPNTTQKVNSVIKKKNISKTVGIIQFSFWDNWRNNHQLTKLTHKHRFWWWLDLSCNTRGLCTQMFLALLWSLLPPFPRDAWGDQNQPLLPVQERTKG